MIAASGLESPSRPRDAARAAVLKDSDPGPEPTARPNAVRAASTPAMDSSGPPKLEPSTPDYLPKPLTSTAAMNPGGAPAANLQTPGPPSPPRIPVTVVARSRGRATGLEGQATLARVAREDKDWRVRMAAVERLTNQDLLASIALRDADVDIRKMAVSLLTRQSDLARVATKDPDWSVRLAAVMRLTDRAALAQVALADKDVDLRLLAVARLADPAATP